MRLIVGLGNPGAGYKNTRHNIGFMTVESLSKKLNTPFRRSILLKGYLARKGEVLLAKPYTFMNLSGGCVKRVVDRFKVALSDMLVICDDLSLPFAKLRLRAKGSSGGHKGLSSIADFLGSQDFPRLRIGIGAPPGGIDPSDFVLSEFSQAEKSGLTQAIFDACECAVAWTDRDIERVMAEFN